MTDTTASDTDLETDVPEAEASESRVTSMEEAEERFQKNKDIFSREWPGILKKIDDYRPMAELVFLENGEPDVLFKGNYLYNGVGAYSHNKESVENFWKTPRRLITNTPNPNSLDKHAASSLMDSLDKAKEKIVFGGLGGLRKEKDCYYLYLLGIGLGVHINDLVEETNAKVVLLVEHNFEFFYQSLFVCDWEKFFKEKKRKGFMIEFVNSAGIRDIAHAMGGIFRKYNPAAVDGTLVYQNYKSSTYDKAYAYFHEKVFRLSLMGLGFFVDEINMIAQSYENLSSGTRRMMRAAKAGDDISLPAIIIGNGPSLDQHFDHLRLIQGKAVIISCGTAIDALLRNDIQPDFQIQIERDIEELRLYRYTARNHDLSKVCLVASTTVYPGIAELFGDTIFFFRPGLSAMPVFMKNDEETLSNPDPSVTNAGLAFALHVGFREVYFFGTDVGAKSNKYHHSKSSLYHVEDLELPWYLDPKHNASIETSFDSEVQGNFGGTVVSSGILLWTKNNLESVIRQRGGGKNFYNCSDGALIDGALPLLASRLKIPDPFKPKQEIMRDFMKRFPVYDRDIFDKAWGDADVFNNIRKMADDMIDVIDEYPDMETHDYSTRLMSYLNPNSSANAVSMLYRGTLFLYMLSIHYFISRAQDQDMMESFQDICREDLKALIRRLRDESLAYFDDAVEKRIDYNVPYDVGGKNLLKNKP